MKREWRFRHMSFRTIVAVLADRVDARGAFDMNTVRRLSVLILLLALPVSCVGGQRKVSATDEFFLYIGSSKSERTESKGIYIYRFKASTGQLTSLGLVKIMNPAFLAVHPNL